MTETQSSEQQGSAPSKKAKTLSSRLCAVQAYYQSTQNKQSLRSVLNEFLQHRTDMVVDGEALVQPDGALLKKILYGIEERHVELEEIIEANLKKDASDRTVEPLLKAVLVCGAYELLIQSQDSAIVINDYLNVTHAFYDRSEVALVNGVLDTISKIFQ